MSQQWTLPLRFREFEAADYERLAEMHGMMFPDYRRTANEWRHWDSMVDKSKFYFHRFACLDQESGKVLGFGQAQHAMEMYHPNKFWLDIYVDQKHHRKGIGSAIYEKLSEEMSDKEAVTLWAMTKEDMPLDGRFAEKRGFVETKRAWESRIDPSSFDPSPFKAYADKAASHGITMSTFAQLRERDPEFKTKLHELVNLVSEDMPRPGEFTPVPYENWEKAELNAPGLTPDAYVIAKDGEKYVGLSALWRSETQPRDLYQGNTGVRREYRGQGIAVAMKLRVLDFARKNRYTLVKTWNDSNNAAMLGINMKLGFKRRVGWILFEKNLA